MSEHPIRLIPAPEGYARWLSDLKTRIHTAEQRATLSVNREWMGLYGQIGRDILERQAKHPQNGPTIGMHLCKSKNKMVAELQTSLSSIEQIERELANEPAYGEDKTR